jgi:N-acetylglutamate synthase-like GNAT family acetyltransferase
MDESKFHNENDEDRSPYEHDYSSVPYEMARFLVPHPAEGPNTHLLTAKEKSFKMPVSFHIEENDFFITGIEPQSGTGAIIWGHISDYEVKIKHIELAKNLRGTGVGKALVADLENQLQQYGIKTAYAAFAKPSTVEFFLKNGYIIIPSNSLTEEQKNQLDINDEDFDQRVTSEEIFRTLKATEGTEFRKILMKKEIGK